MCFVYSTIEYLSKMKHAPYYTTLSVIKTCEMTGTCGHKAAAVEATAARVEATAAVWVADADGGEQQQQQQQQWQEAIAAAATAAWVADAAAAVEGSSSGGSSSGGGSSSSRTALIYGRVQG